MLLGQTVDDPITFCRLLVCRLLVCTANLFIAFKHARTTLVAAGITASKGSRSLTSAGAFPSTRLAMLASIASRSPRLMRPQSALAPGEWWSGLANPLRT